jgi:hypothetical protein
MNVRLWMDDLPDVGGVELMLAEGMDESDLPGARADLVLGERVRFHSGDDPLPRFILNRLGDIYDYGWPQ